jgi:hypothetical protein
MTLDTNLNFYNVTVRIFTASDKSTWVDHPFDTIDDAFASLKNFPYWDKNGIMQHGSPTGFDYEFGFRIFNHTVLIHSDNDNDPEIGTSFNGVMIHKP